MGRAHYVLHPRHLSFFFDLFFGALVFLFFFWIVCFFFLKKYNFS